MKSIARTLLAALIGAASFAATAQSVATFDVYEYTVEGNTVLETVDIERAVYPWLGPGKTADDIEKARAALEERYHQNGYLSVTVVLPVQKVADNTIRLQVVEGEVEKLKVSGNQYASRTELREELPELKPGNVPHFPTMQDQLAQASRSPDRRVTPLLRPGSRPGTMEVEVAVEDELPLHGNIELNNRESPDTTSTRIEAGIRYTNLFQRQHSAGLNYVVSPEDTSEVSVIAGFYNAPLSSTRSISGFFQYSNSDIASASDSNVVGKGITLGGRFSQTLPKPAGIDNFFHSISLGADYKDLDETQNALGADRKQTPLQYMPLVAQYSFSRFGDTGEFSGNLGLVVNLDINTQNVDCQGYDLEQFACRRAYARPDFSVLRGDLSYVKRLLGWEGLARLDFQLANQPLVSPEQILAGGMDSVRGYYEGEAAGDSGWRLRAEITTPVLVDVAEGLGLRAVGFVEGAQLHVTQALPGQDSDFSLASVGLGLRLKRTKNGPFLIVDAAHALHDGPTTERGDYRVHARLGYEF